MKNVSGWSPAPAPAFAAVPPLATPTLPVAAPAAPAPAAAAAPAQPQRQQRAPAAVFAYRRAATPSTPAAAIHAAAYGGAFFEVTLVPGAYVAPDLNRPASSAGPVSAGASLSLSPAAPERPIEIDQAVVGDNFTDDGASSSAARTFFW